jgi:hypothetical protein
VVARSEAGAGPNEALRFLSAAVVPWYRLRRRALPLMHDIEQVKWVTVSQEYGMSLGRLRK